MSEEKVTALEKEFVKLNNDIKKLEAEIKDEPEPYKQYVFHSDLNKKLRDVRALMRKERDALNVKLEHKSELTSLNYYIIT